MLRRVSRAAVYVAVSLTIFLVWTAITRTETKKADGPDQSPTRGWISLLRQIDGTAGAPFCHRRLVADLAPLLARVVPAAVWERFTAFVQGNSAPGRLLRRVLDLLHWPPDRYPDLVAGNLLIWLSVLGFLCTFRWLAGMAYEAPSWVLDVATLLAGVLILGGSDSRWASYPYDLPNIFVFTLTLSAILAGRWWMLAAFALACYSKETAILLIPAYAWVNRAYWKRWQGWVTLVLMGLVYLCVRRWIESRFQVPPADYFWFPDRNLDLLVHQAIYGLWWTVLGAVIVVRVWLLRRTLPRHILVLLIGMTAVLVGAGFFKGWIEERRQYLELLPLVALIGCRWVAAELGLDRWLVTRTWPVDGNALETGKKK